MIYGVQYTDCLHNRYNFHIISLNGIDRSPYLLGIYPYPWMMFADVTHLVKKGKLLEGRSTFLLKNDSPKSKTLALRGVISRENTIIFDKEVEGEIVLSPKEEKKIDLPISVREPGRYDFLLFVREKGRLLANLTYLLETDYKLLSLDIISPFYRNNIYATQKIDEIKARVNIRLPLEDIKGAEICLSLENDKKDVITAKRFDVSQTDSVLSLPIPSLSTGKYILKVSAQKNNAILAQTEQIINKLPYKKGEVWLDKDLNWHVDGKPFFPVGHWGPKPGKNPYFNLYVQIEELSAPEQERGVKRNAFSTASGNWYPDLRKEKGKINDTIITRLKEIVRQEKDKPDLFCYFLCDEPDMGNIPVENLKALYETIREEDPYHPVQIDNRTPESSRKYADCADFAQLDIYPPIFKNKRINDCSIIASLIESFPYFTKHKKSVGFMHQGFNYSDSGWGSRTPTYIELRDQNLLALTVGAKSIIQFNMDVGFGDYPEYDIGIPYLIQELTYLGKAVTAPDSKLKVMTTSDKVRTLLKDVEGELYLFAVNADMEPRDVQITIPGISKHSKVFNVIPEARAVGIKEDTFTDKFDTFEVHVYTTSNEETGLTSVAEVCKKIEAAHQARKKPGNLAFQMYAGDGVTVTASSKSPRGTGYLCGRLWHVVDGITGGRGGWTDETPDEYPDWIEIKLPEKHIVGKMVVYLHNKSLKDYSVQAFIAGEWKEVDKVSGNKDEVITHKFSPVVTDRIRLWITSANGPNSKIAEIEIYEK